MLKLLSAFVLCAACLSLAGCGTYRPLYGKGGDGIGVASRINSVAVQEQHSRAGQILRNELLDGTSVGVQRYFLKLDVAQETIDVAILSSSSASRRRFSLSAHYELDEAGSGRVVVSGKSFSNVEFDTVNVPVSDLQAADNARMRAAKELGQEIRLRLAAALAEQQG